MFEKLGETSSIREIFRRAMGAQNWHWYLGAHMGSPATNNHVESHNTLINDSCTFRERLPCHDF